MCSSLSSHGLCLARTLQVPTLLLSCQVVLHRSILQGVIHATDTRGVLCAFPFSGTVWAEVGVSQKTFHTPKSRRLLGAFAGYIVRAGSNYARTRPGDPFRSSEQTWALVLLPFVPIMHPCSEALLASVFCTELFKKAHKHAPNKN